MPILVLLASFAKKYWPQIIGVLLGLALFTVLVVDDKITHYQLRIKTAIVAERDAQLATQKVAIETLTKNVADQNAAIDTLKAAGDKIVADATKAAAASIAANASRTARAMALQEAGAKHHDEPGCVISPASAGEKDL